MGYERPSQRNLVLTGFWAAGKTTVGRHLARRMRRGFVDLPSEVERRTRSSPWLNLAGIRRPPNPSEAEHRLLHDLSYRRETVVELSPLTLADPDKAAEIKDFSYLVFLDPPFEVLWERVSGDPRYHDLVEECGRDGLKQKWRELCQAYEQCDLHLGNGGLSVARTAQLIMHCFFT